MKRYIAILIFVLALPAMAAAQVRNSYFMEGSTFRTDMNPALAPTRGYVNFPLLGGLGVGMNNNFLSIENMLYPTRDGRLVTFMHKSVDRNDFLKRLPRNNALEMSVSEQLFGFGAHTKRFFWSAGLNLKVNADVNIPKNVFSLLTSLGQGTYNMNNLHLGANAYMEVYVGAAVPIKDFITVGARVKGLIGFANAAFNVDQMRVSVTDEEVSARFRGDLTASCPILNSNMPIGEPIDIENIMMEDVSLLMQNPLARLGNGGVAVDLGAEVRLLDDHLRVSAAVTDLGFIKWSRNATISGKMGTGLTYRGFDFETEELDADNENFDFVAADVSKGNTSRLNCSLNVGAEYAILRNRISFGLLSHTKFCQTFTYSELTASVNFKPLNWITATLSHTLLNRNQPGVFGFALNLHPTGFNLFLGADFIDLKFAKKSMGDGGAMLLPIRQRSVNLNVGLGFSLGRAKYSKAYKEDVAIRKAKKN